MSSHSCHFVIIALLSSSCHFLSSSHHYFIIIIIFIISSLSSSSHHSHLNIIVFFFIFILSSSSSCHCLVVIFSNDINSPAPAMRRNIGSRHLVKLLCLKKMHTLRAIMRKSDTIVNITCKVVQKRFMIFFELQVN